MELHENCFFLVGLKLDFFQVFYKYNFLLSIFLLELCWDAKKQFFFNVGISCCCIQQGS